MLFFETAILRPGCADDILNGPSIALGQDAAVGVPGPPVMARRANALCNSIAIFAKNSSLVTRYKHLRIAELRAWQEVALTAEEITP